MFRISTTLLFIVLSCSIVKADGIILYPFQDSYVRGGDHQNENYGDGKTLKIKHDSHDSYSRKIYISFDLSDVDTEIENAGLLLQTSYVGATWASQAIDIYQVDSVWDESTICWNNAPEFGKKIQTSISYFDVTYVDLSDHAKEIKQNDGILRLAIFKPVGKAEDYCFYHSKESSDEQSRPQLLINQEYALPATANDTITDFIFPSDNLIDWSVAGLEDEIPDYEKRINVQTIGAIADGKTNNYSIIQNAINKAQPGTVFWFPNGQYFFNNTLKLSDSIVIRGESPANTELIFNLAGKAAPSIWFYQKDLSATSPIISGYKKGSTQIEVENGNIFKIGDHIEIIQDNDPKLMYTDAEWNQSWAQDVVGQLIEITNIQENTITTKHPLYYSFSTDLNVRARNANMIKCAGLENFKITRLDDGNDYNLRFYYAYNCWIRNIEGNYCDRGHVEMLFSSHCEIRDSYFHHAYNYGGGGHGYGVLLAEHTTDCLIENSIFHHLRHSFLAKEGAIGNVFAYNYSHQPNGNENDIAMHGHYGMFNLLEGNIVQKIVVGDYWGPSGPGNTFFRNRTETTHIIIQDHSHYQNIIANELLNGEVTIANNTQNTWSHSNKNKSGVLGATYTGTIPNTLFLNEKPAFFGNMNWPPFGNENKLNEHSIPAKQRWENKIYIESLVFDNTNSELIRNSEQLEFFPNPSNGHITIKLSNNSKVTIQNIQGQCVYSAYLPSGSHKINLSHLRKGIYFVNTQTPLCEKHNKFIIN